MKILTAILYVLFFSGAMLKPEVTSSFLKKADKNLERIFKGKMITKKDVALSDKQLAEITFKNNGIYELKSSDENLGFLVFTSSMGRFEPFDYMVVYNPDASVKEISIINYTSPHGGEVSSAKWLKQFAGYNGKKLKYGSDIEALSGATFSASSLVKDVELITVFMKSLTH